MPSVLELLEKTDKYFAGKGIESPRLNAELLLADVLSCKRLNLYLQFDRPLTTSEVDRYREMVRRRAGREPLQYIIGKVEFYGLDFKVSNAVLIPRPETELLVEEALKAINGSDKFTILEIGTGSGNICAAIAKKNNNTRLYSMDVSGDALKVAEENIRYHELSEKVTLINGDIFNYSTEELPAFDMIISNPPYVPEPEFLTLQEEIVKYEPRFAVTDGNDGFSFYRKITEIADSKLNPGGHLIFELGHNSIQGVQKIMGDSGFTNIKTTKDYSGIVRVIHGVHR